MGNFVYNAGLGRVAQKYQDIQANLKPNSAIIITVLASAGLESDAVLKDKNTLSNVVIGTTNEVTNTNYARKVLTDADLVAYAPDNTNDRVDLDFPDQTWTAVASGDAWAAVVVSIDEDTASGTDANVLPLTHHDFVVTPDGNDITLQVGTSGFYRAS